MFQGLSGSFRASCSGAWRPSKFFMSNLISGTWERAPLRILARIRTVICQGGGGESQKGKPTSSQDCTSTFIQGCLGMMHCHQPQNMSLPGNASGRPVLGDYSSFCLNVNLSVLKNDPKLGFGSLAPCNTSVSSHNVLLLNIIQNLQVKPSNVTTNSY